MSAFRASVTNRANAADNRRSIVCVRSSRAINARGLCGEWRVCTRAARDDACVDLLETRGPGFIRVRSNLASLLFCTDEVVVRIVRRLQRKVARSPGKRLHNRERRVTLEASIVLVRHQFNVVTLVS